MGELRATRSLGATRELIETRLDQCERIMLIEPSSTQVQRILSKEWSLSRRQIRKYIAVIRKRWAAEANKVDREQRKIDARERFQAIYSRAMQRDQFPSACRAIERLVELDGLNAIPHIEVSVNHQYDLSKLSLEELKALREIRRKLGAPVAENSDDDSEREDD